MLPNIWGKHAWKFIHFITLEYPINPTEDDKMNYYQYFNCLSNVLPCYKCRYNMAKHLKKYPLTEEALSSRKNLVKWGIDFHNVVNYYNGKTMLSYSEAMNEITKMCTPQKDWTAYYLLIIVAIIIIMYLIYRFYLSKKN